MVNQFKVFPKTNIQHELCEEVQRDNVILSESHMQEYCNNKFSTHSKIFFPVAVVLAKSVSDIQGTLKVARKYHLNVIPRNTDTSVVSGSKSEIGSIILSVKKMNKIIEISPNDSIAVVEPGVINKVLDSEARKQGLFYAPDPGSKNFSSIGGNVATNAGGMSSIKYGTTKNNVLGLKVVLADGRLITVGGRTLKQAFSYDLTHLFVGSEGTLGIIVEIIVKLDPIPLCLPLAGTAFFKSTIDLVKAATALRLSGVDPCMLEALDAKSVVALDNFLGTNYSKYNEAMLIFKLDFFNENIISSVKNTLAKNSGSNVHLTTHKDEIDNLLKFRQSMLPAIFTGKNHVMEDMALPLSQMAGMMEFIRNVGNKYNLEIFIAGHAGDGNIHPTIVWSELQTNTPEGMDEAISDIFRETIRRGGTISGEHAVGKQKKQWNNYELGEADYLQHQIKSLLDPMQILNRGTKID